MIPDIFFYLADLILRGLQGILSAFNFLYPSYLVTSLTWLFGHLNYVSGFINVTALYRALSSFILFFEFFYSYKIALWIYAHLPFTKSSHYHPKVK